MRMCVALSIIVKKRVIHKFITTHFWGSKEIRVWEKEIGVGDSQEAIWICAKSGNKFVCFQLNLFFKIVDSRNICQFLVEISFFLLTFNTQVLIC